MVDAISTGGFDSMAAANDAAGVLVGRVLRARPMSVVIVLTFVAAVAVWVFG